MALQLVDIDHRYGRRPSLHRVSLTVEPGDCYGFIGHNGAGKTTALRIALGLDRPRRGRVLIDGFDSARHPREARARTGGTVEATAFYPAASARKNLAALARLQGLGRRDALRAADAWLDEVGLANDAHRKVGAFSQGMRQRLGLAQALIGEPPYVLLDEPHSNLDPEGVADLRALIRRVTSERHMSVLLSSHQLDEVAGLCNRIGVMRGGRMLVEQETSKLLAVTHNRHELIVDDRERAATVLERIGVTFTEDRDNRLAVELDRVQPRDLVRALVQGEVGVDGLVPQPITLEEVYLELADVDVGAHSKPATAPAETAPAAAAPAAAGTAAVPTARPARRTAPRHPIARMLGHELRRNAPRLAVVGLLAVPAFLAWWRIHTLAKGDEDNVAQVAAGALFSTAQVTGYEALGRGLAAAVPALTVILAAMASQSIAGEHSLGTLRNLVLRPLRRSQLILGKALALACALAASYGAAAATAWISAQALFGFGDRSEIYRDGEQDLIIAAEDVQPYVIGAITSPMLPLLAYGCLGLFAGLLVRRSVWALALGLGIVVVLDLGRTFAVPLGFESWLPSAYLPSPLRDTSYLAFYQDLSIGSAEAYFDFEDTAWTVPSAWGGVALLLALWMMRRKKVL